MLVYFMNIYKMFTAIWNILLPFRIFYGRLVYINYGRLVYINYGRLVYINYGRLVYVVCGHLVYFPRFGMF
jgi:hypothetical protein